MATSYQSDTSPIYAGRFGLPLWAQSIAPNTWGTIPLTDKFSDIDPTQDPLINPDYPSAPEWQGGGSG